MAAYVCNRIADSRCIIGVALCTLIVMLVYDTTGSIKFRDYCIFLYAHNT